MTALTGNIAPDYSGNYLNGNISFGFRRLSIVNYDTGHQPISYEDDTVCIVFNRQISNHLRLRVMLIEKGYQFITKKDMVTVVHFFEE